MPSLTVPSAESPEPAGLVLHGWLGNLLRRPAAPCVLDADERIVGQAWCVNCGGNLARCRVTERCPACGHPASDSVYGDFLIHTPQDRVRQLIDAARFVRCAALFLCGLVGVAVFASLIRTADFNEGLNTAFQIMLAGAFMSPLIAEAGMFSLTARRSPHYYRTRLTQDRGVLRTAVLAAGLLPLAALGLVFLPDVAQPLIYTAWAVVPVAAFLRCMESLLRRVPNLPLAAAARMVLALVWAGGAALLIVLLLQRFLGDGGRHRELLTGIMLLANLGAVALSIAGIRLLASTELALRRAAR